MKIWFKWFGIYLLWMCFCTVLGWTVAQVGELILNHGWHWWQASLVIILPLAVAGATMMRQVERRTKKARDK